MVMKKQMKLNKQTGSALIVALSILLVLTILGVSAMRTTSLQEKMAGNARDTDVAFQAAESAIREAERFLDTISNRDGFSNTGGASGAQYLPRGNNPEAWTVEGNWANAIVAAYNNNQIAQQPRYIIQAIDAEVGTVETIQGGIGHGGLGLAPEYGIFQITARGFGVSPNSRVMLQSMYGRVLFE
jgi:type IV pilus assembly protein PilX